jgi:hypothetical protein
MLNFTAGHVEDRDTATSLIRHCARFRRRGADHGIAEPFLEAMAAALSVACALILVEWRGFDHGQWLVWSAASVATGDTASAKRKLADRLRGKPPERRFHDSIPP